MSTTIDAAIIKTLVEHVGDSSRGISIPVSWQKGTVEGEATYLKFTLPEGKSLKQYLLPGTRLYLNNNQTGYEGTYTDNIDSFIIEYSSGGTAKLYGICGAVEVIHQIYEDESDSNAFTVEITTKEGIVDIPLPDNKTTGFFVPNSPDTISLVVRALSTYIDRRYNDLLLDEIGDVKKRLDNIEQRMTN